jgi:hypothetical protein
MIIFKGKVVQLQNLHEKNFDPQSIPLPINAGLEKHIRYQMKADA